MRELLPFIIVGLTTGSLYGLAGLGLVLTYRTSGVFNFGHGAIAAAAAFLFYTLHDSEHLPWPLAALVTVVLFGIVVGLVMDRITNGVQESAQAVVVVLTVGIILAVEGYLYIQYGDLTRQFPPFLPQSGFNVSGVLISWAALISAAVALFGASGLFVFLRSSRLGVSMRGVVDNATLLSLTGERPARVRRTAWMIGASFAALSGILLAPTLGLDPNLLTFLVVQAFGACAIGYFSNLPMTYVGGLVVGILASISTKYLTAQPWSGVPAAVPFIVLMVVLVAVPSRRLPQPRVALRRVMTAAHPLTRRSAAGLLTAGGTALLLIPALAGSHLPIWINAMTYAVLFGSLALLVWTSAQLSLCHMAFAALGATTMAHLVAHHVPWAFSLVIAGLATVPAGALIALPAIRLSGIYLALVTLGFGVLMQDVVFQSGLMFGSAQSLSAPRPRLGFIHGASDTWMYYIALFVAVLTCIVLVAIAKGQLGRLLRALAESPTMLATHGLSVSLTRLIVFCVSAFFAGIAGAMMITQFGSVSGQSFSPLSSILLFAVLAICGTRLLRSTIIAAGLISILPGYVTSFGVDRQTLAFGLAAIVAGLVLTRRTEILEWVRRASASSASRGAFGPVSSRSIVTGNGKTNPARLGLDQHALRKKTQKNVVTP